MKLLDLDAQFVKNLPDGTLQVQGVALADADGVMFQCPRCAAGKRTGYDAATDRRYVEGAHYVLCWFTGRVPDALRPLGRWNPSGTGLRDLTFVGPGACSVKLLGDCAWHGFVKNGDAA